MVCIFSLGFAPDGLTWVRVGIASIIIVFCGGRVGIDNVVAAVGASGSDSTATIVVPIVL